MIREIPLRPTPVEIQLLGTAAWTFELGRCDRCLRRRSGCVAPGKAAGDTIQKRTGEVRVQGIRLAAEGGQTVSSRREPGAEEAASGLGVETENRQGNSCAGSEGVVVWGEGCAKEGEVAVGRGNLVGREDIQYVSDKTMEGHVGQPPSEESPGEDVRGRTDCMEVGRGGHVEMEEVEGDRLDARLGKHSRSGQCEFRRSRGGKCEDLWLKITSKEKLTCGECVEGVLIDVEPERGRLLE